MKKNYKKEGEWHGHRLLDSVAGMDGFPLSPWQRPSSLRLRESKKEDVKTVDGNFTKK